VFVVFCQAAIPIEPAEGSFDDPAFGQELESVKFGAFDDLDQVTKHGLAPIDDTLLVTTIDEDYKQRQQDKRQADQDQTSAGRFGDACRMNGDG